MHAELCQQFDNFEWCIMELCASEMSWFADWLFETREISQAILHLSRLW